MVDLDHLFAMRFDTGIESPCSWRDLMKSSTPLGLDVPVPAARVAVVVGRARVPGLSLEGLVSLSGGPVVLGTSASWSMLAL